MAFSTPTSLAVLDNNVDLYLMHIICVDWLKQCYTSVIAFNSSLLLTTLFFLYVLRKQA